MEKNTRKAPAIYIANLGEYNEGRLVGTWANLPLTDNEYDEVMKSIMTDEYNEDLDNFEVAIHDYENFPFDVGEFSDIEELSDIADTLDHLDGEEYEVLETLISEGGYTYEEAIKIIEVGDYRVYRGCYNMTDVAYDVVKETYFDLPEIAIRYFDYKQFGIDLDLEGEFYDMGSSYVEVIR